MHWRVLNLMNLTHLNIKRDEIGYLLAESRVIKLLEKEREQQKSN